MNYHVKPDYSRRYLSLHIVHSQADISIKLPAFLKDQFVQFRILSLVYACIGKARIVV